jgi:hypothetical protein
MSDIVFNGKPTTTFWIVGGAALIWNLIGLVAYVSTVTMSPEAMAKLTAEQQAFYSGTPAWATAAFALAVNAGVLGSLFLLLRKAWAVPLFVLSLVAIIVQNVDAFVLRDAYSLSGINGVILPALVFIVGVALLVYSRGTKERGWLA